MRTMKSKYAGTCALCGERYAKGHTIKPLGFDENNRARGFAHLDCWDKCDQTDYRTHLQDKAPPIAGAERAEKVHMHNRTCLRCDIRFSRQMWVKLHTFKGKYQGEYICWKCSSQEAYESFKVASKKIKKQKKRIKELEARLESLWQYTDDVDLVLRTTTDTLKHS
jgi:hypothetical protein